jgi:hypothetical protein
MPLFWKPYRSDFAALLEELKAKKPTLEEEQRRGRALLWERSLSAEATRDLEQSRVKQQAYVYQPSPTQKS